MLIYLNRFGLPMLKFRDHPIWIRRLVAMQIRVRLQHPNIYLTLFRANHLYSRWEPIHNSGI